MKERWVLPITLSLWVLPAAIQPNASQVRSRADSEGPSLAWSWPADGARSVAPGAQVALRFLTPISSAVDTGRIRLSGEAPSAVSLSDDARSLYLNFADLSRKTSYRLVVSAGAIVSRSGVANREAITLSFSTAGAEAAATVQVSVGFVACANGKGAYAFVLDCGGSALRVFDLSDPAHPVERALFILGRMPRAMALAGDQPTVRPAGGERNPRCAPRYERSWQSDSGLAVCVGEHRGLLLVAEHTADPKAQGLRVLDVSDLTNIRSVMGARVGADPVATISELVWSTSPAATWSGRSGARSLCYAATHGATLATRDRGLPLGAERGRAGGCGCR